MLRHHSCTQYGIESSHSAGSVKDNDGAFGALALLQDSGFWRHHVEVLLAAFLIIALSRLIGSFGNPDAIKNILLQSLVMVAFALPLQTSLAVLAARYCVICTPRTASLIGCLLAAFPSTALAMNVLWLSGLVSASDGSREAFWHWLMATYPAGVLLHATLGSTLWMVLSFPWWQMRLKDQIWSEHPSDGIEDSPPIDLENRPDFMKRLSPRVSGQLWALSAERHYVRVTTEAGEELLLMRFTDAVAQCETMNGLLVHRSHWVHHAGVAMVRRENGKISVELNNGKRLPVSRSHQAEAVRFVDTLDLNGSS